LETLTEIRALIKGYRIYEDSDNFDKSEPRAKDGKWAKGGSSGSKKSAPAKPHDKKWDIDLNTTPYWRDKLIFHKGKPHLGNLWRRLALPSPVATWSLTSLQQRLVKTGGRLIRHARYYWLLLAESHLTRRLFAGMLAKIAMLPSPAG
jgi:hypothetical protein